MKYIKHIAVFLFVLLVLQGCKTSQKLVMNPNPLSSIKVVLPAGYDWKKIKDKKSKYGLYTREWVIDGFDVNSSPWVITEEKYTAPGPHFAPLLLNQIQKISRQVCDGFSNTIPKYNPINNYDSITGAFFCSNGIRKSLKKEKSTFTMQRIIADKNTYYIISSELRVPQSESMGDIEFENTIDKFAHKGRMKRSFHFVKKNIKACSMSKSTQFCK